MRQERRTRLLRGPDRPQAAAGAAPDYTMFGEESEAVDYAGGAGELWASVPGALAWLDS